MGVGMDRGAKLSEDGLYRYLLWRNWEVKNGIVGFILLNPNEATTTEDDLITSKCVDYARKWDFGGVLIGSLFAFRASYESAGEMLEVVGPEAVGESNDEWIEYILTYSDMVICGWGNKGVLYGRAQEVLKKIKEPYCLGQTQSSQPVSPMYLPRTWKPKKLKMPKHLG